MRRPSIILHGALAGVAAGAVVAAWFLVLDVAAGQPFRTPTLLAGATLGDPAVVASTRLIIGYTVLHFGVFGVLGVGAAWLLDSLRIAPGLLIGLVFGLGVLNAVHYGALLVTDARVLALLPSSQVLAANLLGGMVLMGYLHRALGSQSSFGPAVLRDYPLVVRGLVAGAIGAGAVAVWFLTLDVLAGRPFYTPAALGSLVLLGAGGPAAVEINAGIVAAYTVLHLLGFGALGIGMVWLAERLEQLPGMWLMALIAFIIVEGAFTMMLIGFGSWLLGALSWWAVGIGNLLAVGSMAVWIWRTHPQLQRQLAGVPADTRV